MKTKDCYTELAIQIATLDMKLDAILKLLSKPKPEITIEPLKITAHDHIHVGVGGNVQDRTFSPQWPNESSTDYLKRMGQCNEAQSTDEQFTENFK